MKRKTRKLYIKLLSEKEDDLAKALLYYITKGGKAYPDKKVYIEKVLERFVAIETNFGVDFYYTLDFDHFPKALADKIVAKYKVDCADVSSRDKEVVESYMAEMDRIW